MRLPVWWPVVGSSSTRRAPSSGEPLPRWGNRALLRMRQCYVQRGSRFRFSDRIIMAACGARETCQQLPYLFPWMMHA